jgi:hypothetical protein
MGWEKMDWRRFSARATALAGVALIQHHQEFLTAVAANHVVGGDGSAQPHFHVLQFSVTVKQQVNSFSSQKEPVGSGRVLGLHDLRRPIAHGIGNAKSDRVGLIIVVPTCQSLIAEANFFR